MTYTATPDSGYQINQWWAGGVVAQAGSSDLFTLSDISSNMLVIVSFAANPTVATSVNPGNAGIVTGGGSYVSGSAVTLTATANSGYTFTNWTENGVVPRALVMATASWFQEIVISWRISRPTKLLTLSPVLQRPTALSTRAEGK